MLPRKNSLICYQWTAVSPDTGVAAVLDRLIQIEPKVLFSDNGVRYNGKIHESMTKVQEITKSLPTLRAAIVFRTMPGIHPVIGTENIASSCKEFRYDEFTATGEVNG